MLALRGRGEAMPGSTWASGGRAGGRRALALQKWNGRDTAMLELRVLGACEAAGKRAPAGSSLEWPRRSAILGYARFPFGEGRAAVK